MGNARDEPLRTDYGSRLRLDGQVHIVVGAGQGIGRQCAAALSELGATVICVGRRSDATERVASEVGGHPFTADAQNREDVERLLAEVSSRHTRLDGIVDVPAIGIAARVLDVTMADWHWQYDNVLAHALLLLQLGAPLIAASGGGSVTLIGSVASMAATEGLNAVGYFTAKAALNHLARVAAVEMGPSNVRVNVVSPALVRTPRYRDFPEDWFVKAAEVYPLRRIAEPSDVASVVLFLASDLARHITGQNIVVDGGLLTQALPSVPTMPNWNKGQYDATAATG
jgi:NAD(P)-dependent dehydrogenase (short-subunit alcohol dehydrogenase family)